LGFDNVITPKTSGAAIAYKMVDPPDEKGVVPAAELPEAVLTVSVEVPDVPSELMVRVPGKNWQLAPDGNPEELQARVIAPAKPFTCNPLIVKLAELPACSVVLEGLVVKPKSGVGGGAGFTCCIRGEDALCSKLISPL
jgi:hypothetical protein